MLTLGATQKPRQTAGLTQRVQAGIAAGQNLPRVALVADVPDDLVARRIESGAERDPQLHDAESGADVAAGLRHDVDQLLVDLVRELLQLLRLERLNVLGTLDRIENQFGLVTM